MRVEPPVALTYRCGMKSFLTLALLASLATPLFAQIAPPADTQPAPRFYTSGAEDTAPVRPLAEVTAAGSGVATAADPRATAAGHAMLQAGGSAADAAIAMMIALTVSEPQSSGIGGGAFLVWYDAKTARTITLDGREKAPAAATPERFVGADGKPIGIAAAVPGGKSVGVPGAVALAAEAHRRWGRLPWAKLFEPSIALARDGIVVTERLYRFTGGRKALLAPSPAAAVFLDAKGDPWPVGHLLRQPELAATLQMLAKDGPDAFYHGPIGAQISAAVGTAWNNPAPLTAADLAAYQVTERQPLCVPYRKLKICTMAPPSAGGIAVLQTLKQLERFDMAKLGPDNLLSWHLFAESLRLAFADREAFGADADFVSVPVVGLLDPAYLAARSALIRIDRAMPEVAPGVPPGSAPRAAQLLADIPATSHMAAADADGNLANLTATIEGPFGSGLIAGGFMLNNELTDFDMVPMRDGSPAPNRMQPGKRPRSSMAPTIVYDGKGRAIAAFGAAGGATIIAQVAKAIMAYADWGMPVEQAIAAPVLVADRRGVRLEKGSRLGEMAAGFKALGHANVIESSLPLKTNGIMRTGRYDKGGWGKAGWGKGGRGKEGWRAAADPRSEGAALALP